jgi:hypothetical protein
MVILRSFLLHLLVKCSPSFHHSAGLLVMVHIPHGALAIVEGVCSAQSCFLNWKFQSSNADCKTFRAALCLIELVKLESWLWQIFALSFWGDYPGGQHSFMNQEKGPVAIVYLENCFIGNALNS